MSPWIITTVTAGEYSTIPIIAYRDGFLGQSARTCENGTSDLDIYFI